MMLSVDGGAAWITTVVLCSSCLAFTGTKTPVARMFAMEFVGSFLIVLTTCSPGPLFGGMGKIVEWSAFHVGIIATDALTGAMVNPAVTIAFFANGNLNWIEALHRIAGQVSGGCLGWSTLRALLALCDKEIAGPETSVTASVLHASISEGFATLLLLAAVVLVVDTALSRNYWFKMSLIAAAVRTIITVPPLLVATGPAINPMIATTYSIVKHGNWPTTVRFYAIYWGAASAGGAIAVYLVRALLAIVRPTAQPSSLARDGGRQEVRAVAARAASPAKQNRQARSPPRRPSPAENKKGKSKKQ